MSEVDKLRHYLDLRRTAEEYFSANPEIASLIGEIHDGAPDKVSIEGRIVCERAVNRALAVAVTQKCDQRILSS